jgi:hypothetical protein
MKRRVNQAANFAMLAHVITTYLLLGIRQERKPPVCSPLAPAGTDSIVIQSPGPQFRVSRVSSRSFLIHSLTLYYQQLLLRACHQAGVDGFNLQSTPSSCNMGRTFRRGSESESRCVNIMPLPTLRHASTRVMLKDFPSWAKATPSPST